MASSAAMRISVSVFCSFSMRSSSTDGSPGRPSQRMSRFSFAMIFSAISTFSAS